MKENLLLVTYRYLHEGGVLQLSDNVTPELLARQMTDSSLLEGRFE